MNYDCMVAEHVNRIGMVTAPLCFMRWHWRWKRRSKDHHAYTLAWNPDGYRSLERMINRLCSPECIYVHASPCMYDMKTVQHSTVSINWYVHFEQPRNVIATLQLQCFQRYQSHLIHTAHLYTHFFHTFCAFVLQYKHYAIEQTSIVTFHSLSSVHLTLSLVCMCNK